MKKQYIETGKIVGTHGIKGEVRFTPWSNSPEDILAYKTLYCNDAGSEKMTVSSARVHKNVVLIKFKGTDSIEDAEKLRNRVLYVSRKDIKIDKGSHLICDLVGCAVYDLETGKLLGKLTEVTSTGAHDVWHIEHDSKDYMIPAVPAVVKSVDVDKEEIVIDPIPGMFDFLDEIKDKGGN